MASSLKGHEFEQVLGDFEGQGSLECGRPWGGKESDMTVTEQHQYISIHFTVYAMIQQFHS